MENGKKGRGQVSLVIFGCLLIISMFGFSAAGMGDEEVTTEERLRDPDYQDELRDRDVTRESDGKVGNARTYLTHDASEKKITIEDSGYRMLFEGKLLTEYTNFVSSGPRSPIANIYLYDYDNSINLSDVEIFNSKDNFNKVSKNIYWEYGVEGVVSVCREESDEDSGPTVVCVNETETDWIGFTDISEIPHKNIEIRILTDLEVGEEGEWVLSINGREIMEWSGFIVTLGPRLEYDNFNSLDNSMVHLVNDTYFLNAFRDLQNDGRVVLLKVNTTDLTSENITIYEFNTTFASNIDMIRVEEFDVDVDELAHVLIVFRDSSGDGASTTLEINFNDFSIITKDEFTFTISTVPTFFDPSLSRIATNVTFSTFLLAHQFFGGSGFTIPLRVRNANYLITAPVLSFEHASSQGMDNSMVQIKNDSLFSYNLLAYRGAGNDGFFTVIRTSLSNLSMDEPGSVLEFDTSSNNDNSLVKLNETHYVNVWTRTAGSGRIQSFTVDVDGTWDISSFGSVLEYDTDSDGDNSLVGINETRYALVHANGGTDEGIFRVFELDLSTGDLSQIVEAEFDPTRANDNSMIQIGNNTQGTIFLYNAYAGPQFDGIARIITYEFNFTITIVTPENITYDFVTTLPLDVINETAIDTFIWSNDSGVTNNTFTINTTIPVSEGSNTITVYGIINPASVQSTQVTFFIESSNCLIAEIGNTTINQNCTYSNLNYDFSGNLTIDDGGTINCIVTQCNLNSTSNGQFILWGNASGEIREIGNWTMNAL